MPKTKTKKKIPNLFDAAGNIRTEKLFSQEAKKIEISQLKTKKDLKTSGRANFKEIFQQLTVVNLLEFFFCPFSHIFRKIKVSRQKKEVGLEVEDPFKAPPPKSKGLASFLILSGFFILSFSFFVYFQKISSLKIKITNHSQQAILALKQGQESISALNLPTAITSFNQAENNFQEILDDFNQFGFLTKSFLNLNPKSKKTLEVSLSLVEAGKNLAALGEILAQSSQARPDWLSQLATINSALNLTLPKIAEAKEALKKIDFNQITPDFREKFELADQSLPQIETGLTDVSRLTQTLLQVLGYQQWQRYLLIFQNNNELRATGGFMGSFALLDVDRGQIKNLEIPAGGTYDLQGSLQAMVASPKPLQLINPIWEFQDANWWPDFPTSAKKIAWFYEQAEGPSVDGVIAFDTEVMKKLLEIVGPIAMPQYQRVITAENFVEETQKIVELEYLNFKPPLGGSPGQQSDWLNFNDAAKAAKKPKQFLADLAPEILKRLFNLKPEDLPKVGAGLAESLKEKHLLVYSFQPQIQKILAALNWSGELTAPANTDYLAVINTNIGGGKTDGVISQIINHQAEITPEGKIIDTVTVTKIHQGKPGDIFTGVQNNGYIRVYTPLGSKLLSAAGFTRPSADLFENPPAAYQVDQDLLAIEGEHQIDLDSGTEIYNELLDGEQADPPKGGKKSLTVFANWLSLKPGEQKTAVLKYELPFSLNKKPYKLFVQKQAGTVADRFSSKIINESGLKVAATNRDGDFQSAVDGAQKNLQFIDKLTTDKYFEVIFE